MSDEKRPFPSPFEALGPLRASLPQGPSREQLERQRPPARAVVRLERSGRKGKEVTLIEHLGLPVDQRPEWLATLKSKLGCGGAVEGEALVLQGDLRTRLEPLLKKLGVKRVTVAN